MNNQCKDCKFLESDYIWDEEDQEEYEVLFCAKQHNTDEIKDCEDYKRFKPRRYKEEMTKCDMCQYLHECMNKGEAIDCTTVMDTMRHYICDISGCKFKDRKGEIR